MSDLGGAREASTFRRRQETAMRKLLAALTLATVIAASAGARAQAPVAEPAPDCAARATEKKLAGAALNSFMKKCERDTAQAACDVSAKEKKLAGAARASFTKKCVKDASAGK
jgi:hypothetical protein